MQWEYKMNNHKCFEVSMTKEKIAHVVLSRPDKRNSMNIDFWREFPDIISEVDQKSLARVILISSTGPHFCSGLDVSLFQSDLFNMIKDENKKGILLMDYVKILQDALSILQNCRLPVITAIQGGCIGGGLDLACASDIRLGQTDCYFSILETKLGLVADIGTFPRITKLIPDGLVRELAFTGRKFKAEEAAYSGFVNRLYPTHEKLLDGAFQLARSIAENSPLTVYGCKEAIKFSCGRTIEESLNWVKMWNSSMLNSRDIEEGFKSSITKKPGEFSELPKKIKKLI